MKKQNNIKIITLILSVVLLVGCVVGISVYAEENAPTVEIKATGISYEGAIRVLYVVNAQNIPQDATLKMYFYDTAPEEDDAPDYVKDKNETDYAIGDVAYPAFFSNGVAPKDMRKTIYSKVVALNSEGAVIAESEVSEYSVWQYAINRFEKNPTEEQKTLYSATLNYGAAVQKMLVANGKLSASDIQADGGYANEYCGIRQDVTLDGVTKEIGETQYYAPNTNLTLTADNMYGDLGVFKTFSDSEGNSLVVGSYAKKDIVAATPGVTVYSADYEVTGSVFNNYDNLCTDGSSNDVNVKYKGVSGNYTSSTRFPLGFQMITGEFGNSVNDTRYVRIVESLDNADDKYILSGTNKTAKSMAFSLESPVYNASKYIFQMDFNWEGRTDSGTGAPVYIRFESAGMSDAEDIYVFNLNDTSVDNTTYTISDWSGKITLNKGQWYTIRFEIVPRNSTTFNYYIYVDGVLAKQLTGQSGSGSTGKNNVNKFLGVRIFTRDVSSSSCGIDNTYVGFEMENQHGSGKYYNDETVTGSKFSYDGLSSISQNNVLHSISWGTVTALENTLAIKKEDALIGSAKFALKNEGATSGGTYVFETDIILNSGKGNIGGGGNLGWFGFGSGTNDRTKQFLNFQLNYACDMNGDIRFINIYEGSTAKTLYRLLPGVWYNVRMEYTPANTADTSGNITAYGGTLALYVNGTLVSTTTVKGFGGSTTLSNESFEFVGFDLREGASSGASDIDLRFDNTFIGTIVSE